MAIDWKAFAEAEGLNPEEFRTEIFSTAAILGAIELDRRQVGNSDALKFDAHGIELYIRFANTIEE
jgi:hypothetical protein